VRSFSGRSTRPRLADTMLPIARLVSPLCPSGLRCTSQPGFNFLKFPLPADLKLMRFVFVVPSTPFQLLLSSSSIPPPMRWLTVSCLFSPFSPYAHRTLDFSFTDRLTFLALHPLSSSSSRSRPYEDSGLRLCPLVLCLLFCSRPGAYPTPYPSPTADPCSNLS
jgi:hypothetical protein